MRISPTLLTSTALALGLALSAAHAQESGTTVIQPENVRMDFAQVMRVQPIYQVLRATRTRRRLPGS